jgi:glycolate oxidase iron-sulfur subunit
VTFTKGPLGIDDDELSSCVSCGLCLPHCPTFRVTGEEALSPRGRIAAMRSVERDGAPVGPEFEHFITTCVQCRGCEPACPSGVQYGHLVERARAHLTDSGVGLPRWFRTGLRILRFHRLLLAGGTVVAVAARIRAVPRGLVPGWLPVRRGPAVRSTVSDTDAEVWLFTGCVMDVWFRDVHRALARVLDRLSVPYAVPGRSGGCCGALHAHAGLTDDALRSAHATMASMPGDGLILVDSAGCGAHLKEYGRVLGSPEAIAFSARVRDALEWVATRTADLEEHLDPPTGRRPVVVVDACHHRHVQRVHTATREVLALVADVVELDDDGLCCGAGGAYSVLQARLAGEIRELKASAITRACARSEATTVVVANPGCTLHLAGAGVRARHPLEIVAEALV